MRCMLSTGENVCLLEEPNVKKKEIEQAIPVYIHIPPEEGIRLILPTGRRGGDWSLNGKYYTLHPLTILHYLYCIMR